jgi:hypothetical protein
MEEEKKKEPIILYREIQKIGNSFYLNIKASELDFHEWKEGTKLKLNVEEHQKEE